MPTFSAIGLDRLLDHGVAKSAADSNSTSKRAIHSPKLEMPSNRVHSSDGNPPAEKKSHWAQISPALYATPEATPLPGSPTSFPPSPYIIDHKRRGPRLLKSSSGDTVTLQPRGQNSGEEVAANWTEGEKEASNSATSPPATATALSPIREEKHAEGSDDAGGNSASARGDDLVKLDEGSPREDGVSTDFFNPQESMSYASMTDGEDNGGAERSPAITASMAEFFDAWEELSSESGSRASFPGMETEIHGLKMNLLMEIERRRQVEEALNNMQDQWRRIARYFSDAGFTIPPELSVMEDEQSREEVAEEVCQQVYIARLVSESVGRGVAKAEMEMKMESQLQSKNFEVARLLDRLHYYEAMTQEMSQRNQETIEMARHRRQKKRRRQRWLWGWVGGAMTLGGAALAWSYLPGGDAQGQEGGTESQPQ